MAYTPELSDKDSATLRRIAWAMDIPMTETLTRMFETMVDAIDPSRVCSKCKDKSKCLQGCVFYVPIVHKGPGNIRIIEKEDD
ncbi:MAG: hypothetical protein DRH93_03380 [Deltaproteobacteria bacterium]|nr:MAG: hypothetical protein DRH93_03380 [Deltaproteobacteria bacterium]